MEYCKHDYPIDGDGSPGDRCHECIFDEGRAEERAAIVAWLRDAAREDGPRTWFHDSLCMSDADIRDLADAIERGDYRRGKP